MRIAVIGIDRYRTNPLSNAVRDALGVLETFESVGFERATEPLLDDAATGNTLKDLVTVGLEKTLRNDDSLVVFFAGHGRIKPRAYQDGPPMSPKGYLLPIDADDRPSTWLALVDWLSDIAHLPPRHVLVILDSCYGGIALDRETHSRGTWGPVDPALDPLRASRSRRVIASARHDERALDGGPVPGHSLFAGCLLEAIAGGMFKQTGESEAAGLDLGAYIRRQVQKYANARQTPTVGTLEGHADGELFVPLARRARRRPASKPAEDTQRTPLEARSHIPRPADPTAEAAYRDRIEAVPDHAEGWALEPAFLAALDRHGAERARGNHVLSVVAGEPMAIQTAWATWAARHGYLTLVTDGDGVEPAIAELLAQLPWLRCLPQARVRLAAAARIDVDEVDAALDARSPRERRTWIEDVTALDDHAGVSGWLLSTLRAPSASVPDLAAAPVQGGRLLAVACDLACPTAVLIQHMAPDAAWLERAIGTAAALTTHMPRRCVAVTALHDLVTRVLDGAHPSTAMTMARQGRIAMTAPAQRLPGRGRHRTARVLFEALERDPRTRGRFQRDGEVAMSADGPVIDVELVATRARIAVEIDAWHHFLDPEGYRRDRFQDRRLQRAGYFVMRFLAEDVDQRLASTLDQIALALAARRAQGGTP